MILKRILVHICTTGGVKRGHCFNNMEALAQNKKEQESKHFTSLQIFTSHAEPALDEYLPRKDQQVLEQKQRDEEDKLYR